MLLPAASRARRAHMPTHMPLPPHPSHSRASRSSSPSSVTAAPSPRPSGPAPSGPASGKAVSISFGTTGSPSRLACPRDASAVDICQKRGYGGAQQNSELGWSVLSLYGARKRDDETLAQWVRVDAGQWVEDRLQPARSREISGRSGEIERDAAQRGQDRLQPAIEWS